MMRLSYFFAWLLVGCLAIPVGAAPKKSKGNLTTKVKKKKRKRDTSKKPPVVWDKWRIMWLGGGAFSGTYRDSQTNESTGDKKSLDDVKLTGVRLKFEGNLSGFGLFFVEARQANPDLEIWSKHQAIVSGFDILLPWFPIIAPSIGLHVENNTIDSNNRGSQTVSKLSVRAFYLGLFIRQDLITFSNWGSLFAGGRFHSLNPSMGDNTGQEWDGHLGAGWKFGVVRFDTLFGALGQSFRAVEPYALDPSQNLTVESSSLFYYGQIRVWI